MILNENQISVLTINLGAEKTNAIVEALKNSSPDETNMKYKVAITYISGLMWGWASRLEELSKDEFGNIDVETFRIINDLKNQSERYAEMVGVIRK